MRIIFSNPFGKNVIKKLVFRHVAPSHYLEEYQNDKQSYTHNHTPEQWLNKIHSSIMDYKQVLVNLNDTETQLIHNGKGNASVISRHARSFQLQSTHNRKKNYIVPSNRPYLFSLGITTQDGQVKPSMYSKYKQVNKFIELIDSSLGDYEKEELKIYDFGCGKGYLTFALYDYLMSKGKNVECIGIDLKVDVMRQCQSIAENLNMNGLKFICSDITLIEDSTCDIVVALHACDTATDIALSFAVKNGAQYIFASPCCHKQIRKIMMNDSLYPSIIKHGIYKERMAEIITDSIRCLLLEQNAYKSDIIEFVSSEHSAKNTLIRAQLSNQKIDHSDKISRLKMDFGIDGNHYLEELLSPNIK